MTPYNVGNCPGTAYNTLFDTNVASSWSTLVARSAPCQQGTSITGSYSTGQSMHVIQEDDGGQFICRGTSYGYGASVWYYTHSGWSWAGGANNPQWNYGSFC